MLSPNDQLTRYRLLHGLQRSCQGAALGFGNQQMHVLGHNHITGDIEPISPTRLFERLLERPLGMGAA